MTPTALIDPRGLAAEIDEVLATRPLIVDVQFELLGTDSAELYADGHIPGAVHLPLESALAGTPGPGGRHPLPEASSLQGQLRALGVDDDTRIVVYDQGNSLAAARAWWTLRWAGLADVRVLDGGLAGWIASGGEVTTVVPQRPPGTVTVRSSLDALDAHGAAEIARDGVLIDARTPERFRGESEPIDPVAGHIPGAVNVPMADLLTADGALRGPDELRARFAEAGVDLQGDVPVGAYCGSGITAAHTVLALHEAGIEAVPYIGSWSDWITDPARSVATG